MITKITRAASAFRFQPYFKPPTKISMTVAGLQEIKKIPNTMEILIFQNLYYENSIPIAISILWI
jgi:hypothetical protein